MNGLHTAFVATIVGTPPELRTSAQGKRFVSFGVQCHDAKSEHSPHYLRVSAFDEVASALVEAGAAKGTEVYVEGRLSPSQWTNGEGETKHGLQVAAWRCDIVGRIGKSAPPRKQEGGTTPRPSSGYRNGDTGRSRGNIIAEFNEQEARYAG